MGNYYPPFSLRISEDLIEKAKKVAVINKRSANKELKFIIETYIKQYEVQHGEILVEE